MEILILRFDAPLMSFGGVMVDQHGVTDRFPGISSLAGLLGNALGYGHADANELTSLQARIEFAARWDFSPEPLVDYHTVDLGQQKMCDPGWTTRGTPEHRAGGSASHGTHIRYRHYWANGVLTLAVALSGENPPTLATIETSLRSPARPLFLGRKTCLPAGPLVVGRSNQADVLAALEEVPRATRPGSRPEDREMVACWPTRLGTGNRGREIGVYDRRDWLNQVHTGRYSRIEGLIGGVEA
jgi:CRISPR system Cascade subunit CasD